MVFILLFGTLLVLLKVTNLGKVIRAMRDDPELLSAMGVSQHRVRIMAFGIGSGFSAFAAILSARAQRGHRSKHWHGRFIEWGCGRDYWWIGSL